MADENSEKHYYSEVIGKVVGHGEDGKTYTPIVSQETSTTFSIKFKDDNDEVIGEEKIVSIPYLKPEVNNNILKFYYTNENGYNVYDIFSYDLNNLRGPSGKVGVEFIDIDEIDDNIQLDEHGNFKTDGFYNQDDEQTAVSKLYVLSSNNNADLNGDTYAISYDSSNQKTQWKRVNDAINLSAYTLNSEFNDFRSQTLQKLNCIAQQQNSIQQLLHSGLNIDSESEEYNADSVINLDTILVTYADNAEAMPGSIRDFIGQVVTSLINSLSE